MDLNRKRHRLEMEVARELAQDLMTKINCTVTAAPPAVLAHHFGLVCERMNYVPDDSGVTRIFALVTKDIARRGREVDRLARDLEKVAAR